MGEKGGRGGGKGLGEKGGARNGAFGWRWDLGRLSKG